MMGTDPGAVAGLLAAPSDDLITYSGTDYGSAELAAKAAAKETARTRQQESPQPQMGVTDSGVAGLERLQVRTALLACLEAISRENGQGPIDVRAVDFARYQGAPALVVRFLADGAGFAWAVGPECGADGGGANRL
jgi:hypothetical protein